MARCDIRQFLKTDLSSELSGVPRPPWVRDSPFLRQLRRSTLRMLLELDALSRDHEVWEFYAVKTVNWYRLQDYTSYRLRREPDNFDCLVVKLTQYFSSGSYTPTEDLWDSFLRIGRFDFRWPVYYWFYESVLFSCGWSPDLLSLLREAPASEVRAFLEECGSGRDLFVEVTLRHLEDDPLVVRDCLEFFAVLAEKLAP